MEQENKDSHSMMLEHKGKYTKEELNMNIKAWRKQNNYLQSQFVNNCEMTSLRNECPTLEKCMYDLYQTREALETILESSVEKIALFGKFEDISRENNAIMRRVHQTVRDLKMDYKDEHSIGSKLRFLQV